MTNSISAEQLENLTEILSAYKRVSAIRDASDQHKKFCEKYKRTKLPLYSIKALPSFSCKETSSMSGELYFLENMPQQYKDAISKCVDTQIKKWEASLHKQLVSSGVQL